MTLAIFDLDNTLLRGDREHGTIELARDRTLQAADVRDTFAHHARELMQSRVAIKLQRIKFGSIV